MESHKFRKVVFFKKKMEPHCLSATSFRDRVFTRPDDREYLWKLGEMSCEVLRTSETCCNKDAS